METRWGRKRERDTLSWEHTHPFKEGELITLHTRSIYSNVRSLLLLDQNVALQHKLGTEDKALQLWVSACLNACLGGGTGQGRQGCPPSGPPQGCPGPGPHIPSLEPTWRGLGHDPSPRHTEL